MNCALNSILTETDCKTINDIFLELFTSVNDKIINNLPVELHIPGYQYCGPGTELTKRLACGDLGTNIVDRACKEHDIVYS